MTYSNINATLTIATKTLINSQIENIKTSMPFLVNLSKEEIIKLGSLKKDKLMFMKKALETAENNPGIIPNNFSVANFKTDMELLESLESIKRQVAGLMEALNDTTLAVRAEAMKSSLFVFSIARMMQHSNIEGIDTIVENLSNAYGTKGKAGRKKK